MATAMFPLAQPVPGLPGAVWATTSINTPIDTTFLTPAENELYQTFTAEQRQREWLAGRRAARAALRAVGAGAASILRNAEGAPQLKGPHADQVEVAITHGSNHAAAVATHRTSARPCIGIDWVDPSDLHRIQRIRHRVLTPNEHELCKDEDVPLRLAWGAREAMAKATQTGMFRFALAHVHLKAIDQKSGEALINYPEARIRFMVTSDHGLVVIAAISPTTRQEANLTANLC
ncbi:MAG: 4'-phosphopantetheinyl transferase superfamily protein [Myxococcales bacterium]|nr:4'-phosphopantetheinyl transferase superfamily protein [Myxococcales bacterium]